MIASRGIHILPPEIMAGIFLMSIPNPARPSITQSPLNVSHTSRLWRDIALSSSIFWAQLCLNFSLKGGWGSGFCEESIVVRTLERRKNAFQAWIQRSGKATLNIVVECRSIPGRSFSNSKTTISRNDFVVDEGTPTLGRYDNKLRKQY